MDDGDGVVVDMLVRYSYLCLYVPGTVSSTTSAVCI